MKQLIQKWFEAYHQDIYHFLVYYCGTQDVEDLLQDVFIACYKIKDPTQIESPKAWLISVARNKAINKQRKERFKSLFPSLAENTVATDRTPDEWLTAKAETIQLYYLLKQLKKNYRDVLILRDIQDLTVEETAHVLSWSHSKVHLTYHRALKRLRELWDKEEGRHYYEQQSREA